MPVPVQSLRLASLDSASSSNWLTSGATEITDSAQSSDSGSSSAPSSISFAQSDTLLFAYGSDASSLNISPSSSPPPPAYERTAELHPIARALGDTIARGIHGGIALSQASPLRPTAAVTGPAGLMAGMFVGVSHASYPWAAVLPYCLNGMDTYTDPNELDPQAYLSVLAAHQLGERLLRAGALAGAGVGLVLGLALPSLTHAQRRHCLQALALVLATSTVSAVGMFVSAAAGQGIGEAFAGSLTANIVHSRNWCRWVSGSVGCIGTFALAYVASLQYMQPLRRPRRAAPLEVFRDYAPGTQDWV